MDELLTVKQVAELLKVNTDFVLVCDASELHPQVNVGRCSRIGDKVWWMTREWKVLDKVTAWMPLPEAYKEEQ